MSKTIRDMDWVLATCLLMLALTGSVVPALQDDPQILQKYAALWAMGILGFTALCFVPLKVLERSSLPIYAAVLLLLAFTFISTHLQHLPSRRWLDLGVIALEPAKMMIWVLIIALAGWFANREATGKRTVAAAFLLAALPAIIIFMQPDFGVFLAVVITSYIIIVAAGLSRKGVSLTLGGSAIIVTLLWQLMHEYQRQRITTLFVPEIDVHNLQLYVPFNLLYLSYEERSLPHAMNAEGLFNLGEISMELVEHAILALNGNAGIIAVALLFIIYALLLQRILSIRSKSRNRFAKMLATGIAALFTFTIVLNLLSSLSYFPTHTLFTGLPFIGSDGGALFSMLAAMGVVMRIAIESNGKNENVEDSSRPAEMLESSAGGIT